MAITLLQQLKTVFTQMLKVHRQKESFLYGLFIWHYWVELKAFHPSIGVTRYSSIGLSLSPGFAQIKRTV